MTKAANACPTLVIRDDRLGVGGFSLEVGGCFCLAVGLTGVWRSCGVAFALATCDRVLSAGGCFGKYTGVGGGLARRLVLRGGGVVLRLGGALGFVVFCGTLGTDWFCCCITLGTGCVFFSCTLGAGWVLFSVMLMLWMRVFNSRSCSVGCCLRALPMASLQLAIACISLSWWDTVGLVMFLCWNCTVSERRSLLVVLTWQLCVR